MSALFHKEWLALRPYWFLTVFIYGLDLLYVPLVGFPDQNPFSMEMELAHESTWTFYGLVAFFLSFSLANGLLVGEKDQGTLQFLDGLPTSRGKIFGAKFTMAFAILICGPLAEIGSALFFQIFSRTSLDPGFHLQIALITFSLHACQIFIFLSLGLVLSFPRRFGWILAAVLAFAYLLIYRFFPAISILSPFEITRPVFEGSTPLIPWRGLTVQMGLAFLLLLLAWKLFQGAGLSLAEGVLRLRRGMLGKLILVLGTVAALGSWTGLLFYYFNQQAPESGDSEPYFPAWKTATFETDTYQISIPSYQEALFRPLIDEADQIHETVRAFLEAEPVGRIVVDATSGTGKGFAGLAFWKTIRLQADGETLIPTLAHETTHVYIESLSRRRMGGAFRWTRFFHEGLAEYVEQRFFRDDEQRAEMQFQAAIAFSRHEIAIEDFMDDRKLVATHDPMLAYPLGRSFAETLVEMHGDEAPSRVLKAMGRKDAPKDLEGQELWRDSFRAAGYNFDQVCNAFYSMLDSERERFSSRIAALPRLYGSLLEKGNRLGIQPSLDFPLEAKLFCRIRQNADTAIDRYLEPEPDESGVFWVDRADYFTLQFQLGIEEPGTGIRIFEPWTDITVGR